MPYIGFGLEFYFNEIILKTKLSYSPLVSCIATDHHHLRNLVTYDTFENGKMSSFDISLIYKFNENFSIQTKYFYIKYYTMTGDSEWIFNDEGTTTTIQNGAGADFESEMVSLAFIYNF